ncbi:MAG: HEAT repeat domain-containing protein, partial [Candidatus Methylumidiphilus sp.]
MAKTISQVAAGLCALFMWVGLAWAEDAPIQPAEKPPEWRIKGCAAALADRDPKVVGEVLQRDYCREAWAFVGREHVSVVAGKLGDKNENVRQAAIQALASMSAKEQVPAIAKLLTDDEDVRLAAIQALAKLGAKEQVPAIVNRLLHDNQDSVRQTAIKALVALDAKEQVPVFTSRLGDLNEDTRIWAIKTLAALGAKEQVPAIAQGLEDPSSHVRQAAVRGLAVLDAKAFTPAIAARLKDGYEYVRGAAIDALAELGAMEQSPAIAERLMDKSEFTRESTINALARLGAKDQAPIIVERLKDEKGNVREAAVNSLAVLDAQEQVPTLVNLLNIEFTSDPEVPDWLSSKWESDSNVRVAAIQALAALGAKEQVPVIFEQLKHKNTSGSVRLAVADALAKLGAKQQLPVVVSWLKARDDRRDMAITILAKLGAKEQAPTIAIFLNDNDNVRKAATRALVTLGAKEFVPVIAKQLGEADVEIRLETIQALASLDGKEYAPSIASQIDDSNKKLRYTVLHALLELEANDASTLASILEIPKKKDSRRAELWALTHFLGGGNENVETALRWLCELPSLDDKPDTATVNKALASYLYFWENNSANAPKLHREMSVNIARLVKQNGSIGLDPQALLKVRDLLQKDYPENAELLTQAIDAQQETHHLLTMGKLWVLHLLFWGLLIFAYPRYRPVQAIFFWNPWVRKLLGLGYVGFLLTWSPRLRRRLLSPFREVLLADARLSEFDETAYFRDSLVASTGKPTRPLVEELARLRGQVLLEGDSGLGKTSFIRQHLKQSKRLAVYLPAPRCGKGVLTAIQAKLKGYAEDERFLKSLIYSGALDVYIDGLNEAAPEVRAQITQFAEDFFRANLLLSSQPMKWEPPASVRTLTLQALNEQRIADFLSSRPLPQDAILSTEEYQRKVSEFLALHLSQEADGDSMQRV